MSNKKVECDLSQVIFKEELSISEYDTIVSSVIESIISNYDNGQYGYNKITLGTVLMTVCTNISMSDLSSEDKINVIEYTDLIPMIKNAIGDDTYNRIVSDIKMGLKYRISTNIETKQLIKEVTNLIKYFGENAKLSSDGSLEQLADMFKSITVSAKQNADKQ